MLANGNRVTVVQMQSERPGDELVHECFAGLNHLEHAIHVRRVDAMKMNRVRVRAPVVKIHADQIALCGSEGGPRYLSVIRPRRKVYARRDFDLAIDCVEFERAQRLAARQGGYPSEIELLEKRHRIHRGIRDDANRAGSVGIMGRIEFRQLLRGTHGLRGCSHPNGPQCAPRQHLAASHFTASTHGVTPPLSYMQASLPTRTPPPAPFGPHLRTAA